MRLFSSTFTAIFLLNSPCVRSEETAKPGPDHAPGNSIATAKKSFEALAKKHPNEERGALEAPLPATPQLNFGAPKITEPLKSKPAKQSKNWLVDGAMPKAQGGRKDLGPVSADSRRAGSSESKDLLDSMGSDETEANLLAASPEAPTTREHTALQMRESSTAKTQPINPLASYMSSWVSIQDRALLLPAKEVEPLAANLNAERFSFATNPSAESFASTPRENSGATAIRSTAQENPYLGSGSFTVPNSTTEAAPNLNLPSMSSVTARSSSPILPIPTIDGAPPSVNRQPARDLAKPDDNAKYFKQLKRF